MPTATLRPPEKCLNFYRNRQAFLILKTLAFILSSIFDLPSSFVSFASSRFHPPFSLFPLPSSFFLLPSSFCYMSRELLQNVRVLDPVSGSDRIADILIA